MKKLVGIQYLRGIAAIAVLIFHVGEQYDVPFRLGGAGVDVFFVISGFIIWATTSGPRMTVGDYFWKRLTRILPLYWIVLSVTWVSANAKPAFFYGHDASVENFVRSLVLLPKLQAGAFHPVVLQGWTLSFEMFFYVVLGVLVPLAVASRIVWLAVSLSAFVLLGQVLDLGYVGAFASPIVLEFVAGVLIAYAAERSAPSQALAAGALVLAVAGFALSETLPELQRVIAWGIPAALLVYAAVGLEPLLRRHPVRLLVYFGDASYSIYLWHVWVGMVATAILLRLGTPMSVQPALQAFVMLAGSSLLYLLVEKPLLALFRRPTRAVSA